MRKEKGVEDERTGSRAVLERAEALRADRDETGGRGLGEGGGGYRVCGLNLDVLIEDEEKQRRWV